MPVTEGFPDQAWAPFPSELMQSLREPGLDAASLLAKGSRGRTEPTRTRTLMPATVVNFFLTQGTVVSSNGRWQHAALAQG